MQTFFCYWAVQIVTFRTQKIEHIICIFCLYVNLENSLFSQILNYDPQISLLCEKSIICYSGLFLICFSTRLDLSTDVSQLILLPWSWEKLTFKNHDFFTFSRSLNPSYFCCHGDIICISIFPPLLMERNLQMYLNVVLPENIQLFITKKLY